MANTKELDLKLLKNNMIQLKNIIKLQSLNYMIFVLGGLPKSCLRDVKSWLQTFAVKPQRGSKQYSARLTQHKNQWRTIGKENETQHPEIIKDTRSDDPPSGLNSTFTKRY